MSVAVSLSRARDLRALERPLVEALAACGEAMRAPASAALLAEGRASPACYLLVEGRVELFLERPGASLVLHAVEPGEVFGHDGLVDGALQRWSARAAEPSTLLRIDRAALAATLRRADGLAALLQERLVVSSVRQLRSATARLVEDPPTAAPAEAPRPAADDPADYVARVAARMGVDPEALEVSVRADADLGPAWKRGIR